MSKTVEDIGTLKINLLSQAQYEAEISAGTVEPNEIYLTPSSGTGVADVEVNGESVVSGGVADITINDLPSGGTTGQVLTKDSNTDYDVSWEDPSGGTITDVEVDGTSVVTAGVAEIDLTGKADVSHTHTKSQITDFPTIPTITDTYSSSSSNGMSGKAVNSALQTLDGTVSGTAGSGKTLTAFSQTDGKVSATFGNISITKSQVSDFPTLATVATSGDYDDLTDKPTIPTITDTYSGTSSNGMSGKAVKQAIDALDGTVSGSAGSGKTLTAFSQTDGKVSATFGNISITKSQVSDFPSLATVATTGDYDDLLDKPTIPTVNDATLTIQKNGTTVDTFSANASSNVTANISVPTDTSDLTNGAGYITGVTSTSTPTASTIAEFDSTAHMNSTDMTAQEIQDFVDSLNVTGIHAVDYVVEHGSSGIWAYDKWNSGKAECWGASIVASNAYSANGGYKQVVATLPTGLFNTVPLVFVSGKIDGTVQTSIGYTSCSATEVQTYLINRSTSAVTQTGVVYWRVTGTWK